MSRSLLSHIQEIFIFLYISKCIIPLKKKKTQENDIFCYPYIFAIEDEGPEAKQRAVVKAKRRKPKRLTVRARKGKSYILML